MFDPDRYRSKDEIEAWKLHDPIPALRAALTAAEQMTDVDYETMEAEVASELDDAVAYAEAGHDEPIEDLTRWVYSDRRPT
jgi:pyruvate dehydrogenase E1 component alpha subunit